MLQRQSSVLPANADPEVRAVRAETALDALKVKFQGATQEYEQVTCKSSHVHAHLHPDSADSELLVKPLLHMH